jgi:hypothetical protein
VAVRVRQLWPVRADPVRDADLLLHGLLEPRSHHGEAEGSKSDPDGLKARRRLKDQSRQPKRTYPRFPGSRKTA